MSCIVFLHHFWKTEKLHTAAHILCAKNINGALKWAEHNSFTTVTRCPCVSSERMHTFMTNKMYVYAFGTVKSNVIPSQSMQSLYPQGILQYNLRIHRNRNRILKKNPSCVLLLFFRSFAAHFLLGCKMYYPILWVYFVCVPCCLMLNKKLQLPAKCWWLPMIQRKYELRCCLFKQNHCFFPNGISVWTYLHFICPALSRSLYLTVSFCSAVLLSKLKWNLIKAFSVIENDLSSEIVFRISQKHTLTCIHTCESPVFFPISQFFNTWKWSRFSQSHNIFYRCLSGALC